MKKKNVIKALAITAGVAAIGYIAKKVHDINEDLKQLSFDDLNDDLFECDEENETDNSTV